MGYRLPERQDLPDPRTGFLDDSASNTIIRIDNGTISRIAIPCFYFWLEPHRRHRMMVEDHLGWPSPDSVDRSSQLPPSPFDTIANEIPIDLAAEGYDSVEVSFVTQPEGLSAEGTITADLVNLTITSMCPSLETEDADVSFSVYATGVTEGYDHEDAALRDVIAKGTLHIVAGPVS